jgi:hypothetical protein
MFKKYTLTIISNINRLVIFFELPCDIFISICVIILLNFTKYRYINYCGFN